MWPGGGAAWSRDGRSRRRRRQCRVPRPPSASVPGRIDRPRSPREASSASTTRPRQAGSDAPTNLIPGSSSPQKWSLLDWSQASKPTLRSMKQLRTLKKPDETSKACQPLSRPFSEGRGCLAEIPPAACCLPSCDIESPCGTNPAPLLGCFGWFSGHDQNFAFVPLIV